MHCAIDLSLFNERSDEFTDRAVDFPNEAYRLLEVGFECIWDSDEKKLFRKRK